MVMMMKFDEGRQVDDRCDQDQVRGMRQRDRSMSDGKQFSLRHQLAIENLELDHSH